MMLKNKLLVILTLLALLLMPTGVLAASWSVGPYTLYTPDDFVSCSPSSTISTSGAAGLPLDVWFFKYDPATNYATPIFHQWLVGDLVNFAVPYPTQTGSLTIFARVDVYSADKLTRLAKLEGQWTVTCTTPPPPGVEGCTPGFWKNHTDLWVGYTTASNFETVFGVDANFSPTNFGYVVDLKGGGEKALGRHAVAALLSAANAGVLYPYTEAQIKAAVVNAYATGNFEAAKNLLASANEAYCPLSR